MKQTYCYNRFFALFLQNSKPFLSFPKIVFRIQMLFFEDFTTFTVQNMIPVSKNVLYMIFERSKYLNELIAGRGNGLVKIITGVRRCGKSFLLFNIWHKWLQNHGIKEDHIIEIQLDDFRNRHLRKPDVLLNYIDSKIVDDVNYYIVLDEVQLVEDFVEIILSLTHMKNVDVYVSGSNSRFLSSDVVTEFRGRGDEIRVRPLTFDEYFKGVGGDIRKAWLDYYTFGGLPQVALLETEEKKVDYLRRLYETTYLCDVIERNHLRNPEGMKELVRILASNIGSSTNPTRIANTFQSSQGVAIKRDTIKQYIEYLKDSFLIEEALRYDVKGRKYIGTETKYYFADIGIRAAILNYRQQEETHIMENIIYNELRCRSYNVDVGMVELGGKDNSGKFVRKQLEVDFVVNRPPYRVYIQSAFHMPTQEKEIQERRSLLAINDHFRKIVIVGDDIHRKEDEFGVLTVGLLDFLTDPKLLEQG